jgi:hypothetical protein
MTRSRKRAVLIYLPTEVDDKLSKYAKVNQVPKTKVVEEAVNMRLSGEDDLFNKGFNEGLNEAMRITRENKGAQMKFPSGKSFAELVCDDISNYVREKL